MDSWDHDEDEFSNFSLSVFYFCFMLGFDQFYTHGLTPDNYIVIFSLL